MASEFTGKIAFITGGASGLGRAAALQLAAQGARVAIADVQLDQARALAEYIVASGGSAIAIPVDVRSDEEVEAGVQSTVATFGRLDIAINAAGIGGPEVKTAEYPPSDWDRVIDINLTGVWRSMRHEIPAMLANGSGVIVNVASVGGLRAEGGLGVYNLTKAALIHLTRQLASELGPTRVVGVAPGLVQTDFAAFLVDNFGDKLAAQLPLKRLGEPQDIANLVTFLVSDAASWITGETYVIDGGAGVRGAA